MASVVSFSGSKGGTGKTTAAHLCAHGAGSLSRPIATVLITTDPLDQLVTDERRCLVVDGRTPQLLADALARYADVERALVIVDGVANRPDIEPRWWRSSRTWLCCPMAQAARRQTG